MPPSLAQDNLRQYSLQCPSRAPPLVSALSKLYLIKNLLQSAMSLERFGAGRTGGRNLRATYKAGWLAWPELPFGRGQPVVGGSLFLQGFFFVFLFLFCIYFFFFVFLSLLCISFLFFLSIYFSLSSYVVFCPLFFFVFCIFCRCHSKYLSIYLYIYLNFLSAYLPVLSPSPSLLHHRFLLL